MSINIEEVKDSLIQWIRQFFEENGKGCNAVVGISGGKDSSVVAGLCVEALGRDKVIGVLMPNGQQDDIDFSYDLVNALGIDFILVNIEDAVNGVRNNIKCSYKLIGDTARRKNDIELSEQTIINLPARIRMSTLYAVAQSCNGRVANTCNLSEDYVGYATRYGDSAGDFSPLANLTSDEVVAIGKAIGLPDHLIYKVPSDGLCGKTDEDNFGFTYEVLNKYIRTGVCDNEAIKQKIDDMHKRNLFKLQLMPSFVPAID